ncbi:MAG: hypothetical protein ACTSYB_02510 [Candidatus Helarchaeota archaeon]
MTLNRVVETKLWRNRKNEGNKYGFFGGKCDDTKQYLGDGEPSEVGSQKEVAIPLLEIRTHRWADDTRLVASCCREIITSKRDLSVSPVVHHFNHCRPE